ncbi:hypothetical protein FQN53_008729 [Emmonsiellopsis sp. PD_33]|nr:hypothetical protein FQN53_008729 [Emmonsiellopsis sp. PD_33]
MASRIPSISPSLRQLLPQRPALDAAQQRCNSSYSFAQERMTRQREIKHALKQKFAEATMQNERARALERQQKRQWKRGDVYAPHDMSPQEMMNWQKKKSPSKDAFDALSLNPLHLYKACLQPPISFLSLNFSIMSEYMTEMGRIRHSSETGLRPVNQRKISKAIRRAVGLGLMPSVHRHPEILAAMARSRMSRGLVP